MNQFIRTERSGQAAFFAESEADYVGYQGSNYRLEPTQRSRNLAPMLRDSVPAYFKNKGIQWHTHANHGLSSQVCCLNFLAPLAHKPAMLARLVQSALGGTAPTMLNVENGPDGPWFVGFEWIGGDYLNEGDKGNKRARGANATAADAVLKFQRDGVRETLLIEWKYTEAYGTPITAVGNPTRLKRYEDIALHPHGPVRNDLGLKVEDFFWEPFYQLLRQQMLAFQMEKAREEGADIVRVLHISPAGNLALKKITAPALRTFGEDFARAWRYVLQQPDRFVSVDTSALFGPLVKDPGDCLEWADYLRLRYSGLLLRDNTEKNSAALA